MFVGVTSPQTCMVLTGRLRRLREAGFRVVLCCDEGDLLRETATAEGVEALTVPMRREVALWADLVALGRLTWVLRMLEPVGFVLREASNGIEALDAWRTWRPHLILMDIVMPGMDGHEATRRLREDPNRDGVKVVALSASAFDEDREAVMATVADDFVRKPVIAEDLMAVIASHLDLEYDYADDPPPPAAAAALSPERLRRLPPDLVAAMRVASLRSDDMEMDALVARLPPEEADLADHLRRLVGQFDWDALDAWLAAAGA